MKKNIVFFISFLLTYSWYSSAQILSESFDDESLPADWTQEYVIGTQNWTTATSNGSAITPRTGTRMADFYSNTAGEATKLITPSLNLTNVSVPQLTFYYASQNYIGLNGELRVYYKTSVSGPWIQIGTDYTTEQASWTQVVLTLPNPSSDYYVAFEGTSNAANGLQLDDVSVGEGPPTCPAPDDMVAFNVTASAADVTWSPGDSETIWNLQWKAGMDFNPENDEGDESETVTGGTPVYNLVDLLQNTTYYMYYQASCGNGDTSDWSGPFLFTPLCDPTLTTFPFTESFDNLSDNQPDCWAIGGTTTTSSYHFSNYFYGYLGNCMMFDSTNNPEGNTSELISPTFDASSLSSLQLSFYYKNFTGGNFEVFVSSNGGLNYTLLESNLTTPTLDDWVEKVYDLTSFISTNVLIKFKGTSNHYAAGFGDANIYLDEFVLSGIPTCPVPTSLTANNITTTTANLSWVAGGSETAWNLEVLEAGSTPTGIATVSGIGNPYTVTGLSAATTYEFYVQADCNGSDTSYWEGPFEFTLCDTVTTFPWTEDFETLTQPELPECWSYINNNEDDDFWKTYSNFGVAGSNAVGLYTDSNSGDNDDYLVLPQFTLTGNERLKFNVSSGLLDEPNNYSVVLSTTGTEPSDFTEELLPLTTVYSVTPTQVDAIDLSAYTGNVHIAIHVPSGGLDGHYIYFDDFVVEPNCFEPSDLNVVSVSDTSADLTWIAGGEESLWNIEVVDISAGETATGIPSVTGVSTTPYTVVSLNANSDYEFYVQADCGVSVSEWVGPFSFSTVCEAYNVPFSENFDSEITPDLQSCWNAIIFNSTSVESSIATSTTESVTASNSVRFYNSDDVTGEYFLISPNFSDLDNTKRITFMVYQNQGVSDEGDVLEVGTMTDPSDISTYTTFQNIPFDDRNEDAWTDLTIDFNTYTGSDSYIAIKLNFGGTNNYYYLDNFSYEVIPPCAEPSDLTVEDLSHTSANLSWVSGGNEASWNIEVVDISAGGVATGTPTLSDITNISYNLTGLSASNFYAFYVQADCGFGTSSWVGPFEFETLCEPVSTFPWTEDFESATAPYLPECWDYIDNNLDFDYWKTYDGYGVEGSKAAGLYTDYNSGNNDDYLILPRFTLTGNEQLKFSVRSQTTSSPNDYRVVLSTTGTAPSDFTEVLLPLTTASNSTQTDIEPISLSAYSGDVYIAIHVPPGGLDGVFVYFDNFIIEPLPSCIAPSGLNVTTVSHVDAELIWSPGDVESLWNIELIDITSGETVSGIPTLSGVSAIPHTLTGLIPDNHYEFYVQADCGGDTSTWAGPFQFQTLSEPVTSFPWTEDFESSTIPDLPNRWDVINNNEDGDFWQTYASYGVGESNAVGLYTLFNAGNNDDYLILPRFTLSGNQQLRFSVRSRSYVNGNDYRVVLSTAGNAPEDFTEELLSLTTVYSTTHSEITPINLSAYTGDVYIAIHVPSGGLDGYYIYFDDFVVEALPSCAEPSNLDVTAVTYTSADLSWDSGSDETSWNIEVVDVTGGGVATGVPTLSDILNRPYTLTGLTANNDYAFYVQAICSDGNSSWVGPYTFSTPFCSNFTPDYTADMLYKLTDICWSEASAGEVAEGPSDFGNSNWRSGTSYSIGPSNSINLYSNTESEWLLSPVFDLSSGGPYELVINVAVTDWNSGTVADAMGSDDEVQLLMSTDGGNSITNITTWNSENQPPVGGLEFNYNLSGVTENILFAIYASDGSIDDPEDYDFHIGKFIIREIPSCVEPSGLNSSNITHHPQIYLGSQVVMKLYGTLKW